MRKPVSLLTLLPIVVILFVPVSIQADLTFKGIAYTSYQSEEYLSSDSDTSLDNLSQTGANYVSLLAVWYMENSSATAIAPNASKSPTDAAVKEAIQDIHNRGMKVMLKPHVDCLDGTWRGAIAPSSTTAWFSSYNDFIVHYASIAASYDVELFSVGCELKTMSGSSYSSNWGGVISNIKNIYKGPLTYSAHWDAYENVCFWSSLDYIGTSAYFYLNEEQDPSLEDLIDAWTNSYNGYMGVHNWVEDIATFQASIAKPVIFTEIGCRSIDYAAKMPSEWETAGTYNGDLQARYYEAAFQVFKDKIWFEGMFWWDWKCDPDFGGVGDTSHVMMGKPAQDVLYNWYAVYGNTAVLDVHQNYPNPFYPGRDDGTAIRYELGMNAEVTIKIYDINMRLVKNLLKDERKECGYHQEDKWSGDNNRGKQVARGVYLCRIEAEFLDEEGTARGQKSSLGKIMLIR